MRRLLFLLLFLAPSVWGQTCHVVGPGASGSGLDFTHPMAPPDNSSFQRGHIYYYLPGTYPKPHLSTPVSGTTIITLQRPTSADHGQTCTPSIAANYNDATMGQPAGPAALPQVEVLTSFWKIEGAWHPANWETNGGGLNVQTGYGFYINMNVGCAPGACWALNLSNSLGNSNITVNNTGIYGRGDAATDSNCPSCSTDVMARAVGGGSNYSFQYDGFFNSSSTFFQFRTVNNVTIDHVWMEHNHATTMNHSEAISIAATNNWTVSNNSFKDIEGTAAITNLSDGTHFLTSDNWNIYGNVFFVQPGNPTGRSGMGNGILSCINDQLSTNWRFVNNTIAHMPGFSRLYMLSGSTNCADATGLIDKDNIWWQNPFPGSATPAVGAAWLSGLDYNSYLQTDMTSGDTGSHTIVNGTAANPFINTTQTVASDYQLASNSNVSPWLNLNATIAGNAIDPIGATRANSRGTFELGGVTPPNAPTGLTGSASGSTVSLSWTASAGLPVPTAYTLYRGTVHNGPYTLIKTAMTSVSTTDTVANGTYFYVVTAYIGGIISTINGNGSVATVTCMTACPSFATGTAFTIAGDSTAGFNGTFTSTGQPTSSTFTFASSTNSIGSGGGVWPTNQESARSNEASVVVGAAITVSAAPSALTFSSFTVGSSSPSQNVTMTNTSGSGNAVTFTLVAFSGTNPGDFSRTTNCTTLTTTGQTCLTTVTFTPTAAGARSAILGFSDNASGSPQQIPVSGTGVAAAPGVSLNPTSLNFGDQTLSTTSTTRSIILTNTGSGTLTISSVVASGDFAVVTVPVTNCGGTLASLATCSLNVQFTPTATGGRTGAVTVTDNASGSPHVATLSGNGITTKCQFTGAVTLSGQTTVCQ